MHNAKTNGRARFRSGCALALCMESVDSEDSLSASHPGTLGSPKVKEWLTCPIKKADCDWVDCHMLRHDPSAQARPDGFISPADPVAAAATGGYRV